jgi:hypothetical protein
VFHFVEETLFTNMRCFSNTFEFFWNGLRLKKVNVFVNVGWLIVLKRIVAFGSRFLKNETTTNF